MKNSRSHRRVYQNEEIKTILSIAQDLGLKGFGGRCAPVAIAMNRVLFRNKGVFVIVVNKFLWEKHRHFAGHVTVRFNDAYWDADAKPKQLNDIDDWGSLGDDRYYKDKFHEYGEKWTSSRANKSDIYELSSENEIPWGHDEAAEYEQILLKAVEQFKSNNL